MGCYEIIIQRFCCMDLNLDKGRKYFEVHRSPNYVMCLQRRTCEGAFPPVRCIGICVHFNFF